MTQSIKNVLSQLGADHLVGREPEFALLRNTLAGETPIVTFVHGIGGIGKTSLLDRFADEARTEGNAVISLDCREIEPSREGLLLALQQATGQQLSSPDEAGKRLSCLGQRVLLVFDHYEVFRIMDSWMRNRFIPALADNTRILIGSREAPVSAWKIKPGWDSLFRDIALKPLDETEALKLLQLLDVSCHATRQIVKFARGHPLTLKLAATATRERPEFRFQEIKNRDIIPQLVQLYLEDVPDRRTREAMEASSVVRRITGSILAALLPDHAPQDLFERIARLPFVNRASDGLIVHEIVREAIAGNLLASDPERYRRYRYLAYRQYQKELKTLDPEDVWRYTADLLYLIEEAAVREAFFPSDTQVYALELAEIGDHADIRAITQRHETAEAAKVTEAMLEQIPQAFRVVRDNLDNTRGYYIVLDPGTLTITDFSFDPLMKKWWQHLQSNPVPKGQRVLFIRRWLGAEKGELPSPVQAACWLDVKGDYVRMRSVLRRVYTTAIEVEVYGPVLQRLGFEISEQCESSLGSSLYQTAVLDFGPGLFHGWIDRLVRAALRVEEQFLDLDSREVIRGGNRIGLTPLEYGVMSYLFDHEGEAVSRDTLLNQVWGREYNGGSNVVDARIRNLRRKLGPLSTSIETVTGYGYRYRNPEYPP